MAEQAEDAEIRKNLAMIALALAAKNELEADNTRLEQQIAQLSNMGDLARSRADSLNSLPAQANIANNAAKSATNGDKGGLSIQHEKSEASSITDKTKEKKLTETSDKEDLAKGSAQKSPTDTSLRDSIQAQIAAEQAALAGADSAANPDAPGDTSAKDNGVNSLKPVSAAEMTKDVFQAPGGPTLTMAGSSSSPNYGGDTGSNYREAPGISLANSESEAEVQKIVGELNESDRKISSQQKDILAGILDTDSRSLFERVRTVHESCVKKGCVAAAKRTATN